MSGLVYKFKELFKDKSFEKNLDHGDKPLDEGEPLGEAEVIDDSESDVAGE